MPDFRNHTPMRRHIMAVVRHYRDHKADLKIDFLSKCGWCDASDTWKTTYFEVDHFIPENILTIKTNTDYSNLIYSCRSCNNSKRAQWPTGDENIPNRNDEGFIDPCDISYSQQFTRNEIGEILPATSLGTWLYKALKLYKPQHQIIWQLEQLEPIIQEIKKQNNLVDIPDSLKNNIIALFIKYDDYRDQLRGL